MPKKKILFVINSLECGGAEKSLVSLLSLMDYEKYDIYLRMFNNEGMFMELLSDKVKIFPELDFIKYCKGSMKQQILKLKPSFLIRRVNLSVVLRKNKKSLHDSQVYWKICCDVFEKMKQEYDVAIAWGQGIPTYYVCDKVNAKRKIAWINTNYGLAGYDKKFDILYYNSFNYIVTVSEELEKIMKTIYRGMESKIITIYDILSEKLINELADKENVFIQNDSKEIKIITVGRLAKAKGYDIATKACKLLKQKGILVKWYIIGEGPERKQIEQDIVRYNIEQEMILLGAKSNPYPYIKEADIYVQTSKFEGYCMTLAEARILNKPIVTTEFEVVYNQIVQEINGLIVKINAKSVADGIEELISNHFLKEKIISNLQQEKKGNTEEMCKFYNIVGGELWK